MGCARNFGKKQKGYLNNPRDNLFYFGDIKIKR